MLGWPLEWVPIVLIVVPILLPLVQKLGIDLVWFCTLVAVCLQTAWLSPPVALSAYFLKGVVPDWDLKDIYAGHDAVHGAAGDRPAAAARLPAARAVAARRAARLSAQPRTAVTALARALAVAETVAAAPSGATAAEVAARTGLPPSTVHRVLAQLLESGALAREPGGRRFAPGARLVGLAWSALRHDRGHARHAILARLVEEIGETCNLTLRDRERVVYLDRVEAHWPLRLHLQPGSQVPLHCTASGKVFLAALPPPVRGLCDRLLGALAARLRRPQRRSRRKPRPRHDARRSRAVARPARRNVDDHDNQEFLAGLVAVGASPVLDGAGRTARRHRGRASGPAARFPLDARSSSGCRDCANAADDIAAVPSRSVR